MQIYERQTAISKRCWRRRPSQFGTLYSHRTAGACLRSAATTRCACGTSSPARRSSRSLSPAHFRLPWLSVPMGVMSPRPRAPRPLWQLWRMPGEASSIVKTDPNTPRDKDPIVYASPPKLREVRPDRPPGGRQGPGVLERRRPAVCGLQPGLNAPVYSTKSGTRWTP